MRRTTGLARSSPTVVSDLDRWRVVEVLDGRNRRRVARYLHSLPERHGTAIEVVSIDPYEAYRQAIQNEPPRARIVVDHFHLSAWRQHRSRLRSA